VAPPSVDLGELDSPLQMRVSPGRPIQLMSARDAVDGSSLIGIEACTSSHHWSRRFRALGQALWLMPPASMKPHVKRQKNDATDAEEPICGLSSSRAPSVREETSVIKAISANAITELHLKITIRSGC
jgi:transposase